MSIVSGSELLKHRVWAVVGDVLNINKPAGMYTNYIYTLLLHYDIIYYIWYIV